MLNTDAGFAASTADFPKANVAVPPCAEDANWDPPLCGTAAAGFPKLNFGPSDGAVPAVVVPPCDVV